MIKCIWGKCLRWFSLCFRGLFGQFGVALKTIYLFGCLRGTLVVMKVLGGFFVSSESVSYLAFIENYLGRYVFIPKLLGDIFLKKQSQYLDIKM